MGSSPLTEALDALVDRLDAAGSPIRSALRPARPQTDVAQHFVRLGLHPTPELIELFAWHDGAEGADLFWETNFHPLEVTTDTWRLNQSLADDDPEWRSTANRRHSFPGPFEWFPALFLDGGELLVVDNTATAERGSVWFTFTQSEPEWLFESLVEGVLAAVWCVEQGLWRPDRQGMIQCDRSTMPTRQDRNHPPWT